MMIMFAVFVCFYSAFSIKIIIEAHDKAGIEKKTGETILDIEVIDENDNAPKIIADVIVKSINQETTQKGESIL